MKLQYVDIVVASVHYENIFLYTARDRIFDNSRKAPEDDQGRQFIAE